MIIEKEGTHASSKDAAQHTQRKKWKNMIDTHFIEPMTAPYRDICMFAISHSLTCENQWTRELRARALS